MFLVAGNVVLKIAVRTRQIYIETFAAEMLSELNPGEGYSLIWAI